MVEVSIIVPVYNVEKYLEKCIKSILNQTFKEFELIIINDGSTDNSYHIIDKYRSFDNRIKVINKENGGLSSARNKGLDIAKGKYILFVDSDDYIDRNMLKVIYDKAIENNSDIVQCKFKRFVYENEINNTVYKGEFININNKLALDRLYSKEYRIEMLVVWNKLYKASIWKDIRFPNGKIHEDVFISHKVIYNSKKITIINDELYFYRKTPNSITNAKFSLRNLDKLDAIRENMDFFTVLNEKKYLNSSKTSYILALEHYYFEVLNVDNGINIAKKLKKEFNKYFFEIIPLKNNTFKTNIRLLLFLVSPKIYIKFKSFFNKYVIKDKKSLDV